MNAVIEAVMEKYSFCEREMTVNVARVRKLLERINTDLEYKKATVKGLRDQYIELVERLDQKIQKLEHALSVENLDRLRSQNGIQTGMNNSKSFNGKKLIEMRKSELKGMVNALNYLLDVYRHIFPEIPIS